MRNLIDKRAVFAAVVTVIVLAAGKNDQQMTDQNIKNQKPSVPVGKVANNVSSLNETTDINSTTTTVIKTTTPKTEGDLPEPGESETEHKQSLTIFFILIVVAICILMTHLLIQTKFHYLPESIAVVLVGAMIGLVLKLFSSYANWKNEEAFPPTIFFIVLLPPIIFESGYNLHKGNFFQNIGSILMFAILGTAISAMVVGGGIYLLGQMEVAYKFTVVESFAFGSLISAVDPVATLAIFHSLNVDTVLYMLVFGESILNDAVAITLTVTVLEFDDPNLSDTGAAAFFKAVLRFLIMFFGSSVLGIVSGLVSAMLLKFVDLRKTPSLEIGMMLVFSYLPYGLAEGLHLSGIMAILASGVVMSHYTHLNLSPVTQITVQHTFRTVAFIAETCVFAYLGMAFFSFKLIVKPAFVIWSIALILIGRAVNIFPLSLIANYFREHKITRKQQFIMWFSGLRGAIAFALSLHLEFKSKDKSREDEKRHVLVTTTLIIVLFTIMFLGGATMPMMKLFNVEKKKKKKSDREVSLSKTKEMIPTTPVLTQPTSAYLSSNTSYAPCQSDDSTGFEHTTDYSENGPARSATLPATSRPAHTQIQRGDTVDSEHLSEFTEDENEISFSRPNAKGFLKLDAKYLKPFFTRRFTQQEVRDGRIQMDHLTKQWYNDVRAAPSESEEEEEVETLFISSRQHENNSQSEPLINNNSTAL